MSELRRSFGLALRAQDYGAAAQIGERLVFADPTQPVVWFNLGYSMRMVRLFEQALEAYGQAIAYGLDRPEDAHINRAHILIEHLQRPEQGQTELEAALAKDPASLGALLSLGQLHEDSGRAQQAAAAYQHALDVSPGCGRALARLASLSRMGGNAQGSIEALQAAIPNLAPESDDFAEVAMALGQAHEAAGNHREAFECFVRANEAARSSLPPSLRYVESAAEGFVQRILDAEIPSISAPSAPSRRSPIFICGMFRSGSTLLESVLARHPRVAAAGELESLPALVARLNGYPEAVATLGEVQLNAMRAAYWAEVDSVVPGAEIIIDKRPDNFLHLGLIRRLFPDSPILHTERNQDDVALSVFGNLFGPAVSYASRWRDIRHWQGMHGRIMDHWRQAFGSAIADVPYEELVTDVEGVMRRVLAFCRLEWSDTLCSADYGPAGVRTLSQWQVRDAVHKGSIGRAAAFREFLPSE
ncbi:sulfotransferase [Novosphingobium sp.]|uniref:tetratricopeptide repeat-containing sulfotransferase family protein n=1 Tax=Novosphingobium sp. TaxID=1874826 RepID=UPI00286E1F63|nr:sulfotransferase [Novosphingobium sp.]